MIAETGVFIKMLFLPKGIWYCLAVEAINSSLGKVSLGLFLTIKGVAAWLFDDVSKTSEVGVSMPLLL